MRHNSLLMWFAAWLLLHLPALSQTTDEYEPPFVPEPKGRGTISLLTTCIVTLSLCVWTAIHMNIDSPLRSRPRKIFNKICWAMWALYAPEIVLWRAYTQWRSARKLRHLINTLPENVRPSTEWKMENGFFAVMGGYRIRKLKTRPDGCVLTPKGVYLLARLKSLPEVETDTIVDRSKADDLVKALACSQAVWMIIQVIGRKASNLPITFLELNTVAHVVCALVMYVVWWSKPQSVNQPEFVSVGSGLEALLSSPFEGQLEDSRSTDTDPKASLACEPIGINHSNGGQESTYPTTGGPDGDTEWRQAIPENQSGIHVTGLGVVYIEGFLWKSKSERIKKAIRPQGVVMLLPRQQLRLEGSVFTSFKLHHFTGEEVQSIVSMSQTPGLRFLQHPLRMSDEDEFFSGKASNMIICGDVVEHLDWSIWPKGLAKSLPMFAVLSMFYGGLHASSWNDHFPTPTEQLLWRISSCTVAGGGVILWAANFVNEEWLSVIFDNLNVYFGIWMIFCAVVSMVFAAARFYLVIESFISVRKLPIGAFSTVGWVNFLPHAGQVFLKGAGVKKINI